MSFSYPALCNYFRQKTALVFGQTGVVLSLYGIAVFNYFEFNSLMLASMVIYLCFFEFGIGSIVFIHIFETNVDSITGVSNQVLFVMVFTTSLITPTLIDSLTVSGTFLFFGSCSLVGLIYIILFVKDTSRIVKSEADDNKSSSTIVKLTEREKKELYWPAEFKSGEKSDKIKDISDDK